MKIYEDLVACEVDLTHRLQSGEGRNEIEDTTRSVLAQLRNYIIQQNIDI